MVASEAVAARIAITKAMTRRLRDSYGMREWPLRDLPRMMMMTTTMTMTICFRILHTALLHTWQDWMYIWHAFICRR
jgi:hypothetical protein